MVRGRRLLGTATRGENEQGRANVRDLDNGAAVLRPWAVREQEADSANQDTRKEDRSLPHSSRDDRGREAGDSHKRGKLIFAAALLAIFSTGLWGLR